MTITNRLPKVRSGRTLLSGCLMFVATLLMPVITENLTAAEPRTAEFDTAEPGDGQPYLLQMVRDNKVHEELRLTSEQIEQVDAAIAEVDPRWWVSRIMPPDKQRSELTELTAILRTRLDEFLDADQQKRLTQLHRQAYGTRMIRRNEVADALDITPAQQTELEDLFAATDSEVAATQKSLADKSMTAEAASKEIVKLQQRERQGILRTLTTKQQTGIGPLVGETFDFSAVRRTYPKAPEFVTEGAQWLVNDGLSQQSVEMEHLRGKVVVVFFYAFQCINCQRNFPHYQAWQADLADRDVVLIGIQTPETSAERDRQRVQQAVHSDGFEFPILFDEGSGNWRAWGNTMWPTTYLIDKKGFIRRWWQGEMNWQGTPGEQQMRGTIEELLAETD